MVLLAGLQAGRGLSYSSNWRCFFCWCCPASSWDKRGVTLTLSGHYKLSVSRFIWCQCYGLFVRLSCGDYCEELLKIPFSTLKYHAAVTWFAFDIKTCLKTCLRRGNLRQITLLKGYVGPNEQPVVFIPRCIAFCCTVLVLHLSRIRRSVNRRVYNARKNINATTALTFYCLYLIYTHTLYQWFTSTLTTLQTRRLREDQIEVVKILNGYDGIDNKIFFKLKEDKEVKSKKLLLLPAWGERMTGLN